MSELRVSVILKPSRHLGFTHAIGSESMATPFQFTACIVCIFHATSHCRFLFPRWIHDYQDACIDKLEKFISGELSTRSPTRMTLSRPSLSKASSLTSASSIHGPGARDAFKKGTSASFDSLMSPTDGKDCDKVATRPF